MESLGRVKARREGPFIVNSAARAGALELAEAKNLSAGENLRGHFRDRKPGMVLQRPISTIVGGDS